MGSVKIDKQTLKQLRTENKQLRERVEELKEETREPTKEEIRKVSWELLGKVDGPALNKQQLVRELQNVEKVGKRTAQKIADWIIEESKFLVIDYWWYEE